MNAKNIFVGLLAAVGAVAVGKAAWDNKENIAESAKKLVGTFKKAKDGEKDDNKKEEEKEAAEETDK